MRKANSALPGKLTQTQRQPSPTRGSARGRGISRGQSSAALRGNATSPKKVNLSNQRGATRAGPPSAPPIKPPVQKEPPKLPTKPCLYYFHSQIF